MVCLEGCLREHGHLDLCINRNLYTHALSQTACCLHIHSEYQVCLVLEIYSISLQPPCLWFCWDCCSLISFYCHASKTLTGKEAVLGMCVCSHFSVLDQAVVCCPCRCEHCRCLWMRHSRDDTEGDRFVRKWGSLCSSIYHSCAALLQRHWPGHWATLRQLLLFLQQMGPLCYTSLFGM